MSRIKRIADSMLFDQLVSELCESGRTREDAIKHLKEMPFMEYCRLIEAGAQIVPPSGQTISPNSASTQKTTAPQPAAQQNMKSIWPGKGAPVEVGMTVGLKGQNAAPIPGSVSQVDKLANGVKVKNPTTGKEEWMNIDALEPYMAQADAGSANTQQSNIQRLKELAGISENCSAGATGAGAIAIAPAAVGKMNRRQPAEEAMKKEYTPKGPAKTIVGDTKPLQATGELSSTLAANGKKTASRMNNGRKK